MTGSSEREKPFWICKENLYNAQNWVNGSFLGLKSTFLIIFFRRGFQNKT